MYTGHNKKQRSFFAWFLSLIMVMSVFAGFNFNVQAADTVQADETIEVFKLVDTMEAGSDYLIIDKNAAGSGHAITNPGGEEGGKNVTSTSVNIVSEDLDGDNTDDVYVQPSDNNIVWRAVAHDDGFDLTNGSDYLEISSKSSQNIKSYNPMYHESLYWKYDNQQLTYEIDGTTKYARYSSGFSTSTNAKTIYIYKKVEIAADASVKGVELDKESMTIGVGEEQKLTETVTPSRAANKNVSWESQDSTIASVDQTGLVKGVKAGETQITVKTEEGNKTASCTVTVKDPDTYKLVTHNFKNNGEYLIVNANAGQGFALTNPGGTSSGASLGSTKVNINSGEQVTINAVATDIVWKATTSTNDKDETGFELTNNGEYLEAYQGYVKVFNSDKNKYVWNYTEDSQLENVGGSKPYIIYFSNDAFAGDNSTTDGNVYIYEKVTSGEDDPQEFKVSFDVQGKGTAPADQYVEENGKVHKPQDPSAEGFDFGGWFKESTCTNEWDFENDKVTEATTIFAKWTEKAPAKEETYMLVSDFEDGEEYLIINSDELGKVQAVTNPGDATSDTAATMGQTEVTAAKDKDLDGDGTDDQYITTDKTDIVWKATAATSTSEQYGNHSGYKLDNAGDYLEGAGGSIGIYKGITNTYVWSYSDAQLQNKGGRNTYTLIYQNSKFDSTYNSTTATVYLYEKVSEQPVARHKVTFDVQGIGSAPADQNVREGGKVTKPADLEAEGYDFGGWFKESTCTNEWDFENDKVTEATTIYAKWTAKAPAKEETYMLVSDFEDGEEYLIINSDELGKVQAVTNPGGATSDTAATMGQTEVTAAKDKDLDGDGTDDQYITTDKTDIVWKATAATSTSEQYGNHSGYKLDNAGDYLEGAGGSIGIYKGTTNTYVWSYSDAQLQNKGGRNTYTLIYQNSKFDSTYNDTTATVYIYKKVETTPPVTETVKVTFDVQGHGTATAPADQDVEVGGKVEKPTDPEDDDYDFGGWFKDEDCSENNEWDFDEDTVDEDTIIYAKWTAKETPGGDDVAVTGVNLNKSELSLEKGKTEQLTATVLPTDATNQAVTWTSEDETIATVDANGLVTAVKKGNTTITVKTVDGEKTATCAVTVTDTDEGGKTPDPVNPDPVNPTPANPTPVNPSPVKPTQPTAEEEAKAPVDSSLPVIDMDKIKTVASAKNATMTIDLGKINADNCKIEYRKDGESNWTSVWTGPTLKVTLNNMKKNSYYQFRFTTFKFENNAWKKSKTSNVSYRWILNTTIKKAKAKGKTMTVTWKKVKGAKGYWVQYSTDKTFANKGKIVKIKSGKTTSKKIKKGLKKGKTYYVRVRPINKKSGKNYLGIFSPAKKVKIKKKK